MIVKVREYDKLADWLIAECEQRGLSWAEASRMAGLSHNTISQVVNGVPPGPKRLRALAEFFDMPPEVLFRMADLLPPKKDKNGIDPEIHAKGMELIEIWQRVKAIDAERARKIMDIAFIQGELAEAAARAHEAGLMDEKETNTA